jgi:transcriptional regulator with XRE-family HTH domain/quercetin dioxygenase-like cupin family protein
MFDKEESSAEVGLRLKELRERRGVSLRELSRLSGLSANTLSMIERGQSSPSVSTLYRLVDALNVPISAVFQNEPHRDAIVFRSVSERAQVPFPLGLWEGLGGEAFVGNVQPFMLSLENGANSGQHSIVHTGHEFVICLQGELEYQIGEQRFLLKAGDSLLFAARLEHRWRNPGNVLAQAVIVLSGFEEFESPGMYHYSSDANQPRDV